MYKYNYFNNIILNLFNLKNFFFVLSSEVRILKKQSTFFPSTYLMIYIMQYK